MVGAELLEAIAFCQVVTIAPRMRWPSFITFPTQTATPRPVRCTPGRLRSLGSVFVRFCPCLVSCPHEGSWVLVAPLAALSGLDAVNPLPTLIPRSTAEWVCPGADRLGE